LRGTSVLKFAPELQRPLSLSPELLQRLNSVSGDVIFRHQSGPATELLEVSNDFLRTTKPKALALLREASKFLLQAGVKMKCLICANPITTFAGAAVAAIVIIEVNSNYPICHAVARWWQWLSGIATVVHSTQAALINSVITQAVAIWNLNNTPNRSEELETKNAELKNLKTVSTKLNDTRKEFESKNAALNDLLKETLAKFEAQETRFKKLETKNSALDAKVHELNAEIKKKNAELKMLKVQNAGFKALEAKIHAVCALCTDLKEENDALKAENKCLKERLKRQEQQGNEESFVAVA